MTQAERDRLVALKKAKKKLITQKQAAAEIGVTERHVRRLLRKLRGGKGDRAVLHELRGRPSNRRLPDELEQQAIAALSDPVYRGFGPTLAAEYLRKRHRITVSKETLRRWMAKAGLWKANRRRVVEVHQWRERRSRYGELVQWDTSTHDWLEGRGERMYLISMIDDATSRLFARFVRHDTREENMRLAWSYLERFGRPLAFYTDKAGMFQVAMKSKRQEQREGRDRKQMPPTQIARALGELGIVWIPAHSPQAKGRVERQFQTAQDRLVKGMRVAQVGTIEEANAYLEAEYLPWWNRTLTVEPVHADDAHRPLGKEHNLAAILSYVEERGVHNYTVRWDGRMYKIEDIRVGLRGADVRVEERLDGTIAVRFQGEYLRIRLCPQPVPQAPVPRPVNAKAPRGKAPHKSEWMKNFSVGKGPSLRRAIGISNARS